MSGTTELIKALTAVLLITVGYVTYYFVAFSKTIKNPISAKFEPERYQAIYFLFQKLTGFLFLGLIPAALFFRFFTLHPRRYELAGLPEVVPVYAVLVLVLLIVATAAFSSRKEDVYSRLPHMRFSCWGPKEVLISIGGWALYLLAYEFVFRGLLLFSTAAAFGVWPAIAINLLVYAIFHIPNGKKEALASIPFGLVLCVLSLLTGSFWMAFMLHLILSTSTEMFSIHYNPGMRFHLMREDRRSSKVAGRQKMRLKRLKGLEGLGGLGGLGEETPNP